MEAWNHKDWSLESPSRLAAFGNQLIEVHDWLRGELVRLRSGIGTRDLRAHCLTFCSAVTRHHTGEDSGAFVTLAERFPELRPVLDELVRDHEQVSAMLRDLVSITDPDELRRHVDGVAALLESHFYYEEKKIVEALNSLDIPEWRDSPPDFLQRFFVVGMDRRGSGGSEPVRCVPDEIRTEMVSIDPAAPNVEDLLDSVREAGQQCVVTLENRLYAMDTSRTTADLDRLREALGVQHLNAIGIGEGSRVLGSYGDRFPNRVGRMVFDGLPDPSDDTLVSMEGRAVGAEATFAEFAKDCVARKCNLGADPKQAYLGLLDQLRATPLTTSEGDRLTAGVAARAVLIGLTDRSNWPTLADNMAAARAGSADALFNWMKPVIQDTRDQPGNLDIALITACNDTKTRLALERLNSTAQARPTVRSVLFRFQSLFGLVAVFVAAIVFSPTRNGELLFLSSGNLFNVVRAISEKGIIAVGMTFVILIGGIDLSVGAVLGLTAVGSADLLVNHDWGVVPTVLVVLLVGLVFGLSQGFASTAFRIQAFIVTLAGLQIARGLARIWSGGQGIAISYGSDPGEAPVVFSLLGERTFNGLVPIPALFFIVIAVLATLFLRSSAFSRHVYAIGGNEKAARLSGIPVTRVKIIVFGIAGLLTALAGIIHAVP
ncbi:alpha/beta fold hydrolase [Kibdelosporangium lantanae]|uniref:Alpha/beta fold hydrolase n=1 Tax=Kibdelosporangium lantanae TaxID=1497396 RepID=A0ABW3M8A3_9PSEU